MGLIPKSKYRVKYTNGDEYRPINSTKPYEGNYIETSKGERFIGNSNINKGVKLIPLDKNVFRGKKSLIYPYDYINSQGKTKKTTREPISGQNKPTDKDRLKGYFNRYFFKDIRTNDIIEVDSEEYRNKNRIDTHIYQPFKTVWYLRPENVHRNQRITKALKKLGSININPYDYN